MSGDLQALAFLLGAMGLGVAAVALIVAIEVARRSQEYLRRHVQEISLTVSRRIQEQDRHLSDSIDRIRGQIAEVERATRLRTKEMMDVTKNVDGRFAAQEGLVTERIRNMDGKTAALEKIASSHHNQMVAMKRILKSVADDLQALRAPALDDSELTVSSDDAAETDSATHRTN